MQKVKTKVNEQWLGADGILRIKYLTDAVIGLPEIKESQEAISRQTKGKEELVLCDARSYFTLTPEAKKYATKEILNNKSRTATAVITNKTFVILLINFSMKFSRPRSAVKMFRKENEALKWLNNFKKDK
jgi:hypothetical protein